MKPLLTASAASELLSRLPQLRAAFGTGASAQERLAACAGLIETYRSLGLTDRAADWVRAGAPLSAEPVSLEAIARYHLAAAQTSFDRGDGLGASRHLARLGEGANSSRDLERETLACQIRLAFQSEPLEPFAALERAFRHLRHHPSSLWAARFLAFRAEWFHRQGKNDEAVAAIRKALAEAEKASDLGTELALWLTLAQRLAGSRTKALRAARTALAKAEAAGVAEATALAYRLVSELTRTGREGESATAFQAFYTLEGEVIDRTEQWNRLAQRDDEALFSERDTGRRLRDARLLGDLASCLAADRDLSRSLDALYLPIQSLMPADVFGIALWVPEQRALDYALFLEEGRRTRVGLIPADSPRSLGAWCFRERKAVRINDIDTEYAGYLKELSRLSEHRPKSMLFQPLMVQGKAVGIITVQSFIRDAYDAEAEAHLSVAAACVALALQAGPRSD